MQLRPTPWFSLPCDLTTQLQVNNGADADAVAADDGADVSIPASVQNKGERKSRKQLQGIGLKKVAGITRVTMKRPRGVSAMEFRQKMISEDIG